MLNKELHSALNLYDEIDWIIIVNKDGIIEYSTIYNEEQKEFIDEHTAGMHVLEIYPQLKEEESSILKVLKTGKPILFEKQTLRDFKGNLHCILNSTVPITENKHVIGVIEVSKFIKDQAKRGGLAESGEYSLEDMITSDPHMLEIKEKILRISNTDSSVLITGETGTGKELAAQSVHSHSRRSRNSFVSLNCAAVPENLLESILFGTVKGAFTGAENAPGLIQKADKGTLFLDEVQIMPLVLQAKLLRFLEDHRVRRMGATEEKPVDVRIISAMNIPPMEAIEKNLIREDLFYRLSVVSIHIPPLRERPGDIPVLTDYFIQHYNKKLGSSVTGVSELVMNLFMNFRWKGNVRELKHVIEGAFNLVKGNLITLKELPEYMVNLKNAPAFSGEQDREYSGLEEKLKGYEKSLIRHALSDNDSYAEAARKLGITRQSLRYKMEKYQLK